MKYSLNAPKKHGFRSSHLGLLLFVMLVSFVSVSIIPRTAQAVWSPAPTFFGGRIAAYVPVIPNPLAPFVPLCPAHIVIANSPSFAAPPVMGIYFLPTGFFQYLSGTLLNGSNLFFVTPALAVGTALLGKYEPTPWPTCTVPYPVFPVSSLGAYLLGTALIPGL
jgi:hypothetical protein